MEQLLQCYPDRDMQSVNYSYDCVTFDPKGKILQVSTATS